MTDIKPVTVADLRAARFKVSFHARLAAGGYLYVYECAEHPRLVVSAHRKDRRSNTEQTMNVDGVECATLDDAAARLSQPPAVVADELAGGPQLALDLDK